MIKLNPEHAFTITTKGDKKNYMIYITERVKT